MEIILKEGEEIRIRAEKGTSEAYMDMICIKNYILKKNESEVVKDSLKRSQKTGNSEEGK